MISYPLPQINEDLERYFFLKRIILLETNNRNESEATLANINTRFWRGMAEKNRVY
jgi:hypothetical protein